VATSNRTRLWAVLIACGLAVGCGGDPAPPTVDAAAEKEDEEQARKANAAEGKKPKGKKEE
jgi:hypothetical protein